MAGTNTCCSTHETIACEDASFPVLVAGLFTDLFGKCPEPLHHATDDVDSAYRRVPTAHPEATVVAIWDTVEGGVRYYTTNGHNFGLVTAVLTFNRASQLVVLLARRLFGVCVAAYFDDFNITEPVYAGASGKNVLRWLAEVVGIPLAPKKDVAFAAANAFLGVVTDLARAAEGFAVMKPKPSRIASIVATMRDALASGCMSPQLAGELAGKLEFTARSGVAGRLGRAALSVLYGWQHSGKGSDAPMSEALREAVSFYAEMLPELPPRRVWLRARHDPPVIVYSDAMYVVGRRDSGSLGAAVFEPAMLQADGSLSQERWHYTHYAAGSDVLSAWLERQQYVGQLEVLAAVAVYTTFPEVVRGRDVVHFIDNAGALYALMNGSSSDVDSARLVHTFHALAVPLATRVWVAYVASKANLADLPSRREFALLQSMGAVWRETALPPLLTSWSESYSRVLRVFSRRHTSMSKRAIASVKKAIAEEQAKRARAV